jgi:hypothetical protein
MLFVGLQFVIWSISGAYMVVFDIDYIHGDGLVADNSTFLKSEQINYSIADLYSDHPKAKEIELSAMLGNAVYRFNDGKNKYLLSADTGNSLSPISEKNAEEIAKHQYNQASVRIKQVSLITENPPFELSARHLPVWRIDFDEFASPSFYISVHTGELVTKRHTFWRIFDWMFSFHVMDYVEEDPSNKLLFVFAAFSLVASLFGLVLTYFRVLKRNRKRTGKRNGNSKPRLRESA